LIHLPVGKRSFKEAQLFENLAVIMDALIKAKPAASKGTYLKSVTVSPTMGPGIKIDTVAIKNEVDGVRSTLLA